MLEILFEDDWLLVVDKPAGLVVHPTYRNQTGTLLDELRLRRTGATLSVVSRLDKLTSGIVVIAKSAEAHAAVQRVWPDAEKEYLAVVHGCVDPERDEISAPLASDPADRRRRIVAAGGAPSVTRYQRLEYDVPSNRSVLLCRLITGRRHQIRVHLASRGWPIVGDAVYGEAVEGFPRHALHAWRIGLTTMNGERVRIESPIPGDFPAGFRPFSSRGAAAAVTSSRW
jgi:23S rRNA pseudouridine1911/1915/1917 synthase